MADSFPPPFCVCVCFTGIQMPSVEESKASAIDLKKKSEHDKKQLTENGFV